MPLSSEENEIRNCYSFSMIKVASRLCLKTEKMFAAKI